MQAQQTAGAMHTVKNSFPLSIRVGNALVCYARYLGKAFWPSRLALIYPHPGTSLQTWQVLAALVALLAVTALVLRERRRRYLLVGWFWFLGTMLPMIGLVQVGEQAMADRYAYLPFIGLVHHDLLGSGGLGRAKKCPGRCAVRRQRSGTGGAQRRGLSSAWLLERQCNPVDAHHRSHPSQLHRSG